MRASIPLLILGAGLAAAAATNEAVSYKSLQYEGERFFRAGAPYTGEAIQTNRQGRLVARRMFKDGRFHGRTEEFATNGQLIVQCDFADGQRSGTNTYWNPDGSLLKRQVWDHGRLVQSTHTEDLQ